MIRRMARVSIVIAIGLVLAMGLAGRALVSTSGLEFGNEAHPFRRAGMHHPSGLLPPLFSPDPLSDPTVFMHRFPSGNGLHHSAEWAGPASVVAAQFGDGSTPSATDVVTPCQIIHLPIIMHNFSRETYLPPGHVFIAKHPRITRLKERLGDGETRVSYFVRNNLEHTIDRFSLSFTAEAATGGVHAVSIEASLPSLFDLSQTDGPEAVTCDFALHPGQMLQVDQAARLSCTYRGEAEAIVVDQEHIVPEPFVADEDYDQVHDLLAETISTAGSEPLEVLVILTRPVEQSDLNLFTQYGGQIEYQIPLIDGFLGTMPADRIMDYRAAAADLDFMEPNLPVYAFLDRVTSNIRAQRVWEGDTDGSVAVRHDDQYAINGDPRTTIAVVDTGLDATHPGLGPFQDVTALPGGWAALPAGTKMVGWRDFDLRAAAAPVDHDGHGSHVAGIAAGTGGGAPPVGQDMRGVAYEAKLMGLRLPQVGAHSAAAANALNWLRGQLANYHVVVVNQSYGSTIPRASSRGWARASQRIVEAGVVLVNAAGNAFDDVDGGGIISTPGNMPKVLTVGAVNDDDRLSYFSSNGDPLYRVTKPDVVAPGGSWVFDNNFNRTAQVTSVDSNQLEPFIDLDGDNVHDPGDRCLDSNFNDEFDTQMDIFLDLNLNWRRDGGEPFNNWNGVGGFQPGGDMCRETHAGPPANQLTGELWLDVDDDGAYDPNGRTPIRDDYFAKVGTSQAAPVVAGEVALIVDAMTDYENQNPDNEGGADEDRWDGADNDQDDIIDEDAGEWVYDEQSARLIKAIVLMTTFEAPGGETVPAQWLWFDENGDGFRQRGADEVIRDVNGNQIFDAGDVVVRQGANGVTDTPLGTNFSPRDFDLRHDPWFQNAGDSNDPRTRAGAPADGWDRGIKDMKEGYGRVAIDAATEAVMKEFCAVEKDSFGNGLPDKKVWARHLHLYRGKEYKALLKGPGGADYDMYLYQGIPDANGEPVIARRPDGTEIKGTTPLTSTEEMTFTVQADGLYFLIVRRVSGSGEFTVRLVTPEEWTIMVYMPAELEGAVDLDALAFEALNDMEQTGSGQETMKDFKVLALVDYDQRAYDGKDGPPPADEPDHRGDAVLYCVCKDHDTHRNQYSIVKQPAEVLTLANPGQPNQRGEADMGDPETLRKFASWAVDHFPAQKYALILWGDGRGYGWKVNPDKALGPGNDNKRASADAADANKDALEMKELRTTLAAIKAKIKVGSQYKAGTGVDKNIDILGFDMGHMALIEVGRQVQESVEVMVASEERIHDRGWPYKEMLEGLKCERDGRNWKNCKAQEWDAEAFAKHIVSVYHTYYTTTTVDAKHTLSAVRLNPKPSDKASEGLLADATFDQLVTKVSAFGVELRQGVEDYLTEDDPNDNVQIKIKHEGREGSEEMEDHNYIDLRHFAQRIRDSSVPAQYKTQSDPIYQALKKGSSIVLANERGPSHPNAHGLTIYYPHDQLLPEDANCKEAPDTGDRTCGFDNPLPSKVIYAKDAGILALTLRQPAHSETHPRPQIEDLRFPQETQWDEFLHRYYKPVADACVRWDDDCVKHAFVFVGQRVTLSGKGSSDSDGPASDDVPDDWYWDLDLTKDNPLKDPDYPITSPVPIDPLCSEDCDRDSPQPANEPDDDPDATGSLRQWTCPQTGTFEFRLMVHDEHNDLTRKHDEETHYVHWKVDDDQCAVTCLPWLWTPFKSCNPTTTMPGEPVLYNLELVNWGEEAQTLKGTDVLSDVLAFQEGSLNCAPGTCTYDPETRTVYWVVTLEVPASEAVLHYTVVPELPLYPPPTEPPLEIINLFQVTDTQGNTQTVTNTLQVLWPLPGGADRSLRKRAPRPLR